MTGGTRAGPGAQPPARPRRGGARHRARARLRARAARRPGAAARPTARRAPRARRCCWRTSAPRSSASPTGPSAPSGSSSCSAPTASSVHLNPLQEAVQPEGEPRVQPACSTASPPSSRGWRRVPVVVKEVGFGLDPEDVRAAARRRRGRGRRRRRGRHELGADRGPARPGAGAVADAFADWGVPTADALRAARCAPAPGAAGDRLRRRARRRRGGEVPRAGRHAPSGWRGRFLRRRPGGPRRRGAWRRCSRQLRIATWAGRAPARRRRSAPEHLRSEGRRDRRRARRPGAALRLQGAGHDVTVVEQRAAPGRARLAAARRRLHVGHRPVADHDAVGARGDVRGRRPRPARRAHAAPARPALPDPLGGRGAAPRLRGRPRAAARGGRAVLRRATPRRAATASWPR